MFCDGFNIAKFVLSIVSIFFDLIFMFQHYILYNPKRKKNQTGSFEEILLKKENATHIKK